VSSLSGILPGRSSGVAEMPNSLRIDRKPGGDATRVCLSGEITEEARFDELGPVDSRVVFDLSGIRRINSSGVREWIQFMRSIPTSAKVTFERCPPPVVVQASMIANFLGAGRIVSFLAPYFC